MINLFKKAANTIEEVTAQTKQKKTQNEIIAEIHETFFTEVERILAEANIKLSTDTQLQNLIDKSHRLSVLGFTSSKEYIDGQKEIERLQEIKNVNAQKQKLIEAVNYFSVKYPNYKFITEDSVKKICKKYGLIYGDVSFYKGEIPDENLKHMEDFKIDECDAGFRFKKTRFIMRDVITVDCDIKTLNRVSNDHYNYDNIESITKLFIAAPKSDFALDNMELNDFQLSVKAIEIPDPIVLQPVMFKDKMHFLIVTAWGLEASDELVVNHKMN